ncbi:hypothetical protein BDA99DRAFT_543335 [Phascolomyces articulosus]|uniref:Uncharacterized protein n=1 Tax=Phascolomyces articulosus TaxID=60185 RepID=A0AAD5JY39_9FUNG|nr:hypothetical protein BDA99DRAFT_543335 [Phascolomyces articulosus]
MLVNAMALHFEAAFVTTSNIKSLKELKLNSCIGVSARIYHQKLAMTLIIFMCYYMAERMEKCCIKKEHENGNVRFAHESSTFNEWSRYKCTDFRQVKPVTRFHSGNMLPYFTCTSCRENVTPRERIAFDEMLFLDMLDMYIPTVQTMMNKRLYNSDFFGYVCIKTYMESMYARNIFDLIHQRVVVVMCMSLRMRANRLCPRMGAIYYHPLNRVDEEINNYITQHAN